MTDGISIAIGSTALGSIVTLIATWIKARFSKTSIEPNPLKVERSGESVAWKDNAKAHENLFTRMTALEQAVASDKTRLIIFEKQLDRMSDRIDKIYERVCEGKKGKKQ